MEAEAEELKRDSAAASPVPSLPKENGLSSTPTPAASPKPSTPPKEDKEDSEEEDKTLIANKLPPPVSPLHAIVFIISRKVIVYKPTQFWLSFIFSWKSL